MPNDMTGHILISILVASFALGCAVVGIRAVFLLFWNALSGRNNPLDRAPTRTERIVCPECWSGQVATVYRTQPFEMMAHECTSCGWLITESEWNLSEEGEGQ